MKVVKEGDEVSLSCEVKLENGDIIKIPAIDMGKEYIVTVKPYFSLDLPEGIKCINFKEK